MTLVKKLSVMKKSFEEEFKDFKSAIERNKETEYGQVINKLLTANEYVVYLFEDCYSQKDIRSMSALFSTLNHAFSDDGEVYIKKILSPLGSKELGKFYQYKIAIGENPKGVGLTYQQLDMLIEQQIETYNFDKENEKVINKSFDDLTEEEKLVYENYLSKSVLVNEMMKKFYKENKYSKKGKKKKYKK